MKLLLALCLMVVANGFRLSPLKPLPDVDELGFQDVDQGRSKDVKKGDDAAERAGGETQVVHEQTDDQQVGGAAVQGGANFRNDDVRSSADNKEDDVFVRPDGNRFLGPPKRPDVKPVSGDALGKRGGVKDDNEDDKLDDESRKDVKPDTVPQDQGEEKEKPKKDYREIGGGFRRGKRASRFRKRPKGGFPSRGKPPRFPFLGPPRRIGIKPVSHDKQGKNKGAMVSDNKGNKMEGQSDFKPDFMPMEKGAERGKPGRGH